MGIFLIAPGYFLNLLKNKGLFSVVAKYPMTLWITYCDAGRIVDFTQGLSVFRILGVIVELSDSQLPERPSAIPPAAE